MLVNFAFIYIPSGCTSKLFLKVVILTCRRSASSSAPFMFYAIYTSRVISYHFFFLFFLLHFFLGQFSFSIITFVTYNVNLLFWRQGGNITTCFALFAGTEYQMHSSRLPTDFKISDMISHWWQNVSVIYVATCGLKK